MKSANIKTILTMLVLFGLFFWSLEFAKSQKAEYDAKNPSSSSLKGQSSQTLSSVGYSSAVLSSSSVVDSLKDSVVPQVQSRKILIRTKNYEVTFNSVGAKIEQIVYTGLKDDKGQNPEIFQNDTLGALAFAVAGKDFNHENFEVIGLDANQYFLEGESKKIQFRWTNGSQSITRTFTVNSGNFSIPVEMQTTGFEANSPLKLTWLAGMKETDAAKIHREGFIGTDYFFSEAVYFDGADVHNNQLANLTKYNEEHGQIHWAGIRRKYVAAVVDFARPVEGILQFDTLSTQDANVNLKPSYRMSVEDKLDQTSYKFNFVLLPLEYHNLTEYNREYEDILWSGYGWFFGADYWFPKLCGLILKTLNIFFNWIGNYGIAIILLTLVVRGLTTPLTLSQLRSTRLLQEHKPGLDKVREQYGKDPRKYQEQVMAYYRENGINPFAPLLGCFPVLLQMPVFIALFVVLARAVELRDAAFFGWIVDLSSPDILTEVIKIPFVMPAGLSLLPFLMAITSWYQTKQTITDPNMKMMVWMMPMMMFLFSGLMPSGLVIYWIISNIYSIVQYMLIGAPKVTPAATQVSGKQSFQKTVKKKK